MKTLTVKVHEFQDDALADAARAERVSKSELVRRSLTHYLAAHPVKKSLAKKRLSAHDRLKKYIPKTGTGIRDLASNPKYMEGYGRD